MSVRQLLPMLAMGCVLLPLGAEHAAAEVPLRVSPLWSWLAQVNRAEGVVTPDAILCQSLPLEELTGFTNSVRIFGYQPARIRPYRVDKKVFVAGVWQRTERFTVYEVGLTRAAVGERDATLQTDGYAIADVAGYADAEGERYAAVWERAAPKAKTRFYVGVPEDGHGAGWQKLRDDKCVPATLSRFKGSNGVILNSGVWRGYEGERPDWGLWWGSDSFIGRKRAENRLTMPLLDVTGFAGGKTTEPGIGGVWGVTQTTTDDEVTTGSSAEIRRGARKLRERGFHPASVAAEVAADDRPPRFIVLWHRERPAEVSMALKAMGEARQLYKDGKIEEAITTSTKALDVLVREAGEENMPVANLRYNLASYSRKLGRHDKAIQFASAAVSSHKAVYGAEHLETALTLILLGHCHTDKGEPLEAARAYEAALPATKRERGGEADYRDLLFWTGRAYADAGDLQRGERYLLQAVALFEKADKAEQRTFFLAITRLGQLYLDHSKFEQAIAPLRKARDVAAELGKEVAMLRNGITLGLAISLHSTGQPRDALPLFREATAAFPPDSSVYRTAMAWRIDCHNKLNDPGGIPVCEELIAAYERAKLSATPEYAKAWKVLGDLLKLKPDSKAATTAYRRALEVYKKTRGEGSDSVIAVLMSLARLLTDNGELLEAEAACKELRDTVARHRPTDRVSELSGLVMTAHLHAAKKEYPQAEAMFTEAIRLSIAVAGEHSETTTGLWHALGRLHEAANRPAQAESALLKADECYARTAPASPQRVEVLRSLANARIILRNTKAAEETARLALELARKVHGERSREAIRGMIDVGNTMATRSAFPGARDEYEKALKLAEEVLPAGDTLRLQAAHTLAGLCGMLGDRNRMLALREQVVKEAEPGKNVDPAVFASRLILLAEAYTAKQRPKDAEATYRKACEWTADKFGKEHPEYARCLTASGVYLASAGQSALAETTLKQAHDILKPQAEKHPEAWVAVLEGLAGYYAGIGDLAKAKLFRDQAGPARTIASSAGQDRIQQIRRLHAEATTHELNGEYAKAEPLLLEIVRESREQQGEGSVSHAIDVLGLGVFYLQAGDLGEANHWLTQATELFRKLEGPTGPMVALTLGFRGQVAVRMGDDREADRLFQEAEAVYAKSPDQSVWTGGVRLSWGTSLLARGKADAARPKLAAAFEDYLRDIDAVLPGLAEAEGLLYLGKSNLLSSRDAYLESLRGTQTAALDAYSAVWRSRALVFRYLTERRDLARESPEAAKVFEKLQGVRRALAETARRPPDPKQPASHQKKLQELSLQKEDLEKQLATLSKSFARQQSNRSADLVATLGKLPEKIAFVDIVRVTRYLHPIGPGLEPRTEEHYEAFVIRKAATPEGFQVTWVPLDLAAPIEEAVGRWTGDLLIEAQTGERPKRAEPPDTLLRTRVWLPIEKALGGDKQLLIVADGQLSRLPWSALPGETSGSYLIEAGYAIGTLPYGQRLASLFSSARPPATDSVLLAGGIDYNQLPGRAQGPVRAGPRWDSLPMSATEIRLIRSLFKDHGPVRLLEGALAHKQALIDELPKARIVHLATHGFFDTPTTEQRTDYASSFAAFGQRLEMFQPSASAPLRHPLLGSGVVLAGANLPDEFGLGGSAGLLTAEEVAGLDLSRLDLVVLSACETALGRIDPEGVRGLQTSFQLAGARSVVASLWKVEDRATQALTTEFYKNLIERKLGRLEALRQAQLTVLTRFDARTGVLRAVGGTEPLVPKGKPGERTPAFFWAAFVLSGDWR